MDRPYDIVLFGASGFTGALTAACLAESAGPAVTWAMAGRNRTKMEALGIDVPIMYADASDPVSLAELAARARVVVTTAGPYIRYGEPLVAACAEAGTHYLDLAGEPEFVDRVYLRHHATAARTGARLVHACSTATAPTSPAASTTRSGGFPPRSPWPARRPRWRRWPGPRRPAHHRLRDGPPPHRPAPARRHHLYRPQAALTVAFASTPANGPCTRRAGTDS